MGLSSLRLSTFGFKHPWLPLTCLVASFVWIVIFLAGCYAMANSEGHLYAGLPAISALGDKYPEHILFAVGFAVLALIFVFALYFRAAQIDLDLQRAAKGLRVLNVIALVIGWLGAPFLIVMGAIPDSSDAGVMHFVGAGVAMGCFALSLILTTIVNLIGNKHCDEWVNRVVRIGLYLLGLLLSILAISFFIFWMMGHQDQTIFEWLGVALLFLGFAPNLVFFARYRRQTDDMDEKEPLVEKS